MSVSMALTNLEAIMISVLALMSFSVTNFNFSLYHLFMWRDKERSCRLLNVFYGYIAAGLQAGSAMCLASLFRDKILDLEIEHFNTIFSNFYIARCQVNQYHVLS